MNEIVRPENTSVVICCAGMGTRLGIGTTKALVDICGKPLIMRQLELLKNYDDIRIVVGFDAERVIRTVKEYRKDIMFVCNYDYKYNGPADSLRKALLGIREFVVILDGDTIPNPDDFDKFLSCTEECVAVSKMASGETIAAQLSGKKVICLAERQSEIQWSGIAKIRSTSLKGDSPHVYDMVNRVLPLPAFEMRLKEINTQEDYDRAIEWFTNGMID